MTFIGKSPCDEAAVLHGAQTLPCPAPNQQRWTLAAAILGSSMAFLDGSVVNVALPALQHDLYASASQTQWIVESYALFLASLLLVGGALGDRFGRRRVFMLGAAVFTAAGLWCGLAGSAGGLIAARAVQGMGAALLVPGSLALISATHAPDQRGRAIGIWSALSGVAAAIGPVLGGVLVDHFSWRWAFFINLPLGIALLIMCATRVPESRPAPGRSGSLDVVDATLLTLGLAALVFAFIEAPVRGWGSLTILAATSTGMLALAGFAALQIRSRSPMLPRALLRSANFAGANVLTLLLYAALGGGLYFLPLNLIQVQGYTAAEAGAALLPFIVIMLLLSGWAGTLVERVGPRLPLLVGPVIAAGGFALLAVPGIGGSYWLAFLPGIACLGLGMALTVAPLTTTVMNSAGTGLVGLASGVNNAVSRIGGLLAIAVLGLVMSAVFNPRLSQELAAPQITPALRATVLDQRSHLAAISLPAHVDAREASAVRHGIGESFVAGFRTVMLICAGLSLLGGVCALALIRAGRPQAAGAPAAPH
jgi:EmrB/QacA subfamily drug resistance transporter